MRRTLAILTLGSLLVSAAAQADGPRPIPHNQQQHRAQGPQNQQVKVDLVIALDTSGSMSGLINAARQKLWDIVNEVGRVQPAPRLRVGLVTFGSSGSEQDGYVIIQSHLTTDLDAVNAKLFELSTNGGTEYVARTVYRAVRELRWDKDPTTLRQIYVAGNESATQDRKVSLAKAMGLAKRRGVFVNAIYCGAAGSGEARSWAQAAQLGNGVYAAIDHNHGTVAVNTPYDAKLNALSQKLNRTYIAYGKRGRAAKRRQAKQDRLAASAGLGTGAARAKAKASGVYKNSSWDLVDAKEEGKLNEVAQDDLPDELQQMDKEALQAHVSKVAAERAAIRAEIKELSEKRTAYVKQEMKKQGKSADKAFDTAVKRALHKQAAQKNIVLK